MYRKNNEEIIFLKPYLSQRIWGGKRLKQYGFSIKNNEKIGEAWIISAISRKESIVKKGKYKNLTLKKFYMTHKYFFDNFNSNEYPLLLKILDFHQDSSIQLHPTQTYANKHKNIKVKNEAWFILKKGNRNVVLGHNATSIEEFKRMVNLKQWDKLFKKIQLNKNDAVFVPSGEIHGMKKGFIVLEIQQPSDTTFRLYDYEREKHDPNRKLHIYEVIENISQKHDNCIMNKMNNEILTTKYFSLYKIHNKKCHTYPIVWARWLQCFVYSGFGRINGYKVKKGDTFIFNSKIKTLKINGNIDLLISYIRNDV